MGRGKPRLEVRGKLGSKSLHCASQGLIPQDLLSHIHASMVSFLHSFYFCYFISTYSFHNYLNLYGSW